MPGQVTRRLTNVFWSLVVVVLVVSAIFVGVGRQLTDNIDAFRSDLENLLTDSLGYRVEIDELRARWHWLDPVLQASGVRLLTDSAEPYPLGSVSSLRIRLDTLKSLLRQRVVFENFEADGLDLTVVQSSDGRLMIDGLRLPEATAESGPDGTTDTSGNLVAIAGRWLSDPSVRITRVGIRIRTRDNQTRLIDIPQLDLEYDGGLFSASGRAMQGGTTHQLAGFRLIGLHFFRGDFTGQIYLNLNSGRLFDELVSGYRWRELGVDGFDIGGEAWLTFRSGALEQVNGQLMAPYLQVRAAEESLAPMEDLALKFGWRGSVVPGRDSLLSGEWHLSDIRWRWLGESVSGFSLFLRQRNDRFDVRANGVPVGPLAHIALGVRLLPEAAVVALEGYRPEGQLDNLTLIIPSSDQGPAFSLATDFQKLKVSAFHGAPELVGARGTLELGRSHGTVRVVGEDVTIGFPRLFRSSWPMSYADVRVSWDLNGPITRVYSSDIHLLYRDKTEFSGGFDLRLDREGEDNLGLQVALRHGEADLLAEFVPDKVVAPALYDWLTTAVSSASIDEGAFYGFGQIDRGAPRHSFTSSMWYRFSQGQITYDPAWPEVRGARGRVSVHDGRTLVTLESAETGGLSLSDAQVRLAPTDAGLTLLVDAETAVPGSVLPYWLENSPLGEMSGLAADALDVGGRYALDLGLQIPLDKQRAPVVDIAVVSDGGAVRYPGAGLDWRDITGKLTFNSQTGFSADPVSATFLGKPVEVGFEYRPDQNALSLSQTGRLTIPEAQVALGLSASDELGLSGAFVYTARLDVAKESSPGLSLYSSLRGVTVDWPEPLAKPADELRPLSTTLSWEPGKSMVLAGQWQEALGLRFRWDEDGFERGAIAFGRRDAQLPETAGIAFNGHLERLNVEAWADRISRISLARDEGASAAAVNADALIEQWLSGINLSIGELEVLGQVFPEVEVRADYGNGRWRVDSASDWLAGRLDIPMDTAQTVQVDMQILHLTGTGEEADVAEDNETPERSPAEQVADFRALKLENWPRVHVSVDGLMVDDRPMGSWSFQLQPGADALDIRELQGTLDSLTFNGGMVWDIRDGRQTSRLMGTLAGEDLGDLAQLVGEQAPLRNAQSRIELNVAWPGRPDEMKLRRLEGEVGIRLDDGVILENNYTAQLFRLFNVLNADNLWRRLQLDFSDLYEAGVAFDAISGTAVLNAGVLTWNPELQIVGPSGAFKLSGSANMMDASLDMRLVVVLPLTQNLPLAAILLGASAPIGGALFVLDKVLGDPLSRLTSATYSVQGNWSEPEVSLRNVFDTGN